MTNQEPSSFAQINSQVGVRRTYEMLTQEITEKLSSKKDWYTYLKDNLQYYLPPYVMITKDHMKQVLKGEKKFLKMMNVKIINVPDYDEIGVKHLYERVVQRPGMAEYFPDKFPIGRTCNREYMYNVWNTMHPEDVKEVIEYANSQRYSIQGEKVKEQTIIITEDWKKELDSMPFISKQKGRMSFLLKQKSKVAAVREPRTKYEPYKFEKRMRDGSNTLANSQFQPQAKSPRPGSNNPKNKIKPTLVEHGDTQMNK